MTFTLEDYKHALDWMVYVYQPVLGPDIPEDLGPILAKSLERSKLQIGSKEWEECI